MHSLALVTGLLMASPPGVEVVLPAVDLHGDPLPSGARARLGTVRWRHEAPVRDVAISTDGRTAVTLSADGRVHLFELSSGKRLMAPMTDASSPEDHLRVAIAPDGRTLSTLRADGAIVLWDRVRGGPIRTLAAPDPGAGPPSGRPAFSPDARFLAWPQGRQVRLAHTAGAEQPSPLGPPGPAVRVVAFHPRIGLLAVGREDGSVELSDPATGGVRATLRGHRGPVRALAFSPDGEILASGGMDTSVKVWDLQTSEVLDEVPVAGGEVSTLGISRGRAVLAVAIAGGPVLTWDLVRHRTVGRMAAPAMVAVGPAAEGGMVGLEPDGVAVRALDVERGRELWVRPGHTDRVVGVALAADGRTVVTCADRTLRSWSRLTAQPRDVLVEPAGAPAAMALSPDGRTAATAIVGRPDSTLRVWDLAHAAPATTRTLPDVPLALGFSPDGRVLSWLGTEGLCRIDATTGSPVAPRGPGRGPLHPVAASADGETVATRAGRALAIHDVRLGRRVALVEGHASRLASFAPEGPVLASSGVEGDLVVIDPRPMGATLRIHTPMKQATCLALSRHGRHVALGGPGGQVFVHDPTAAHGPIKIETGSSDVTAIALAPDGSSLATGHPDGTVLLWDLGSGR